MQTNKQTITGLFTAITLTTLLFTSCHLKDKGEKETKVRYKHDEQYVQKINDGSISEDGYIGSIPRRSAEKVDSLEVKIDYSSPGVRNRKIWGELIPYDSLWVAGANAATSMEFSKTVKIAGKLLPAGKYAFFTIPGRKEWTMIFNKDYQQHLTDDYDEKKDVLRFLVTPDTLRVPVRRLTYDIEKRDTSAVAISMSWEKLRISFDAKAKN